VNLELCIGIGEFCPLGERHLDLCLNSLILAIGITNDAQAGPRIHQSSSLGKFRENSRAGIDGRKRSLLLMPGTGEYVHVFGSTGASWIPFEDRLPNKLSPATKAFLLRKKLAELTGGASRPGFEEANIKMPASIQGWMVDRIAIRGLTAQRASAIEQITGVLFLATTNSTGARGVRSLSLNF